MTKLNPIGLYNTFKTVAELEEYILALPKDEQQVAWLVFGLTWNTCAFLTDPKNEISE